MTDRSIRSRARFIISLFKISFHSFESFWNSVQEPFLSLRKRIKTCQIPFISFLPYVRFLSPKRGFQTAYFLRLIRNLLQVFIEILTDSSVWEKRKWGFMSEKVQNPGFLWIITILHFPLQIREWHVASLLMTASFPIYILSLFVWKSNHQGRSLGKLWERRGGKVRESH